ncbi:MAG: hypothetical protein ACR2QF_03175 [Geminicoccaceae bacterium]
MAQTRDFHVADILSVTHGYLISSRHIDGVYDVLNFLTGQNLYTHQLPRASEEIHDALLAQLPQWFADLKKDDLGQIIEDFKLTHVGDSWLEPLIAHFEDTYGQTFPLAPVSSYQADDPVEELRDMVDDQSKVIEVRLGSE